MSNLIKNKLLITVLTVISALVMYDVGWSAVTPMASVSSTRTTTPETQDGGWTKILHATTVSYVADTITATGWYGDTLSYVLPVTSLSGVTSYSISAWIVNTASGTKFSDSIGNQAGDTITALLEYSMDGSRWYSNYASNTPAQYNMTKSTTTGTNVVTFGPFNREQSMVMDSTADLHDVRGVQAMACAQYVRMKVWIHGVYDPAITPANRVAVVNYKSIIMLKKD